MRRLSILFAVCAVAASMMAGCDGDGADTTGADGGVNSGLATALSRVSPIEGANLSVYYDSSAVLADLLAGREPVNEPPRYEELVGFGATSIAQYRATLDEVGIDLSASEYSITVGAPPSQYALVAGGQDTETLTTELTENGWSADGDELVAPDLGAVDRDFAQYAMSLSRVAVDGSELVYGGTDAVLSLVDNSDDGLLGDERVSSVAGCLGDVVAALINTVELREATPTVGLGVRTPADADQRPEVIVCTLWETDEEATAYADRATADLTDGTSLSGQPFSEVFDPAEAVADGALASWETGTDLAMAIFRGWMGAHIPGMIVSCDRMTAEQFAAVEDYC